MIYLNNQQEKQLFTKYLQKNDGLFSKKPNI